jgi:hypothetical protein
MRSGTAQERHFFDSAAKYLRLRLRSAAVDNHDLGRFLPVRDHRLHSGLTFCSVADDHGVVPHLVPPSLDLERLP